MKKSWHCSGRRIGSFSGHVGYAAHTLRCASGDGVDGTRCVPYGVRCGLFNYFSHFSFSHFSHWPVLVIVVFLGLVGPGRAALPDIGSPEDAILSVREEQALGREIATQVWRTLPVLEDPELSGYLTSLGRRLLAVAPGGQRDFQFFIVADPSINAFAAPGGIIVVNTGLILAAANEAELAAVLAHEIAHVSQRHIVRAYSQGRRTDLASQLALLAAVLIASYGGQADLAEAALYSSIAANVQQKLAFSRSHEHEADRVGIEILAESGFAPSAMADFFATLQRRSFAGGGEGPEFLSTHPLTAERISDARGRAAQMAGPFVSDSLAFQLAKARTDALTAPPESLQARIEEPRPGVGPDHDKIAARYFVALAHIRLRQGAEAISLLTPLLTAEPDRLPFQLAVAEALIQGRRFDQAIERLVALERLFVRQPPVVILLAEALLHNGEYERALTYLNAALASAPASTSTPTSTPTSTNGAMLKLKAKAAALTHRPALSHETMAAYYESRGLDAPALDQIELALAVPELPLPTRQRLESKRQRLRQGLRRNGLP